jgi:predicted AlkP superfamily pyrophosphatase or phosphodiesterase
MLVLQIIVNQLRGDMLQRYYDRFEEDGLKKLMDIGTYYTRAHWKNANSLTLVNHASIATGGYTRDHGIVDNTWFDRQTGKLLNCVVDENFKLIDGLKSKKPGYSPTMLTSSTTGDELIKATKGKSRVFSIAEKSKCAIFCGGHKGKAFWFNDKTGRLVSSTYYYKNFPGWAADWNRADKAGQYSGQAWDLLKDRKFYLNNIEGYSKYVADGFGLGKELPHPLGSPDDETFYKRLMFSPMADYLVVDFLKALMDNEKPGQKGHTDMVSVSLNSLDLVGHLYGPSSLEYEDCLYRVDQLISKILKMADKQVGPDKTLIVLTSDHGINDIPAYLKDKGKNAGRVDVVGMAEHLNRFLKKKYDLDEDAVFPYRASGFAFKYDVLKKHKLGVKEVEKAAAAELVNFPGIAHAFTRTDLLNKNMPKSNLSGMVLNSFHPERSGNVLVVQKPDWFLLANPNIPHVAMHGSPYDHDTHVPLIFCGPGIKPKRIDTRTDPVNLAATLCALLGINMPSGSVGVPLLGLNK